MGQKPKSGNSSAGPLKQALWAMRSHFIAAGLFSALLNLLYLTPTLYMMQVYDRVVPTAGLSTLALLSGAAAVALFALSAMDWLRGRLLVRAGLVIESALSKQVLARTVHVNARSLSTHSLRQFDSVRTALTGPGAAAVLDLPWIPIYLGCCFLLHWSLGILTLAGGIALCLLAWLNQRVNGRRMAVAADEASRVYSLQETMAVEAEVIRALGMRKFGVERQSARRELAVEGHAIAQLSSTGFSSLIRLIRLLLQSAALGLAAILVVGNEITAGSIIAASVLLSRSVAPVEQLVSAWPTLLSGATGWRALETLFANTSPPDTELVKLPAPEGNVELRNVMVRYPGTEAVRLHSVTLDLKPGQLVGVMGRSGAGKSTLVKVISGAMEPTGGEIRMDGSSFDAWDTDDLGAHIGYLPQNPTLFEGSIRDNIARFSESPSTLGSLDDVVIRAAIAAGAHEMILRLPEGYNTILGLGGTGLSGGQAQRLALARALFKDPVLLVLDEPNSNLDHEGEAALTAAILKAAHRGASVLVVAHRAALLSRVDRLIIVNAGTIQMDGPREEVLEYLRGQNKVGSSLSEVAQ